MAKLSEVLAKLIGGDIDIDIDLEKLKVKDSQDDNTPGLDGDTSGGNDSGDDDDTNSGNNTGNKQVKQVKTKKSLNPAFDKITKRKAVVGEDGDNDKKTLDNGGNNVEIFSEGWLDKTTGKIDITKIKDETVANALNEIVQFQVKQENDAKIGEALAVAIKNENIKVTPEFLIKALDTTGITVADGKVTGIQDSIDKLKQAEPGLFGYKAKKTSPVMEGFNPVNKNVNDDYIPRTAEEAAALMGEY